LTGPHTFIANTSDSKKPDAIKASVPKLLSCLGSVLAKAKTLSIFRPFFSLQHRRV